MKNTELLLTNSLRSQRRKNAWTQAQVAEKIGVSRKTICSIERGRIVPSTYIALKLAAIFQVRVENLFQLHLDN